MPIDQELTDLLPVIARAFATGRIVPFLGAGASLIGRGPAFALGANLPTGGELAGHLARQANYPQNWERSLPRVSQFMVTRQGPGPLYSELHGVFSAPLDPNPLHRLLATLTLRDKHPPAPVIVTTNYDTLLEDAMRAAAVPFDVLTYLAKGRHRGQFRHTAPDGTQEIVESREWAKLAFNKTLRRLERPLVLKIHGTFSHTAGEDSFVITEEDYIEYLARTDVSLLLPSQVAELLAQKHFLFLGYSLSDWNLRVLLSRVWQRQEDDTYRSWAANRDVSAYDRDFWRNYEVDCHEVELADFAAELAAALDNELGPCP
jgi:hypothetical protein